LSHQRKRKTKQNKSGDSFVNVYLRLWLTCHLLLSAVAGFIYADLRNEVYTSPSPAGFVYLKFSWMHAPFVFSRIQPYLPVATVVFFII
jgi:hypothetical protein